MVAICKFTVFRKTENCQAERLEMKCPKCGYNIHRKKLAADMGKKGGSVSSPEKKAAAKAREERKRKERGEG